MQHPTPTKPKIASLDRVQRALEKIVQTKAVSVVADAEKKTARAAESYTVEEKTKVDDLVGQIAKYHKKIEELLEKSELGNLIGDLAWTADELRKLDLDFSEAFEAEDHFSDMIKALIGLDKNIKAGY